MSHWPIGVFASIDAGLGVAWPVIRELGLPTIQLHAPHAGNRTADAAQKFKSQLDEFGIQCTAVFGGFDGESYADIPTVVKTVGLVPAETRAARLKEMMEISDFARALAVDCVALHIGFVPHDPLDQEYEGIVEVTRQLCDHCRANEQFLHLETGQETADGLLTFIESVERDNLKINFDPANMILYGSGDPIEALRKVGPYVRSVHCKDGTWSDQPGVTFGREVPLGQGDVGMENYLQTLKDIGYTGPLTIEREIPEDPARQKAEIGDAVQLLTEIRSQMLV
ncbi:sugar phosphate isomerase/epimerase [Rhodopirellula sp. JC740]|uniref:Sugar phosphate isomerase/epimerase n=1 Tax=Rhodopirellula halodulae TaxID=2894198 RepID=A0ABS8NHU4_9BACT|nr:sugar phosphate isomerase/epimerase family protein [Rhodopirellula sp. JC740]MCC9643101.1 sugar phosphate isomerase/epimerase [Rhodopirellula sp. JC740]